MSQPSRPLTILALTFLLIPLSCRAAIADTLPLRPPPRKAVEVASGKHGMVVSDTPLASEIGADVLASGGNAVDAAVAVGIALQVTWPEAGNIGGGGFMMVSPAQTDRENRATRSKDADEVVCFDFRETAPGSVNAHSMQELTNRHDVRFVGTPGTVRGMEMAQQEFGRMDWKDLLAPSIKLAKEGFEVDAMLAYSLNSCLADLPEKVSERDREFRRVYGGPHEGFWKPGDRLVQTDLAGTLQAIADRGSDAFYRGSVSKAIVAEMESQGGWITSADLAAYRAIKRAVTPHRFLDYEVFVSPLPSSGGVVVPMQLAMVEQLGLERDPEQIWTAEQVHLITEVMRRAFRDRAAYLGDPDFVRAPVNLLSSSRIQEWADSIDRDKATPSRSIAGDIAITDWKDESENTTHFSIVDEQGMAVSMTYTLEQSFGSRVVVKNAGFLLNNEMGDFNPRPGETDTLGTIGTTPNQLAPRKRMLSSMSPTIVKKDGRVRLLLGSPGGRTIINTVTLVAIQRLLFARSLAESVDAPRFHHQWFPDQIQYERDNAGPFPIISKTLVEMGHNAPTPRRGRQGSLHAIELDPSGSTATGVADWRRGGAARAASPGED